MQKRTENAGAIVVPGLLVLAVMVAATVALGHAPSVSATPARADAATGASTAGSPPGTAKWQAGWDADHEPAAPAARPKPSGPPEQYAPAAEADPAWPTGIVRSQEAPAPAAEFLAYNHWTGTIGKQHLAVYAGTAGSADPTTGAILVTTGAATAGSGRYLTTPETGELRVTGVDGEKMSIVGADGSSLTLDLGTLELSGR